MLRHACGYALANKGIDTRTLQAYLGHRSIQLHHALCRAGSGQVQKHLGQGVERCTASRRSPWASNAVEHADGLCRGFRGRGSDNRDWNRRRDLEYEVVVTVG
jgi:hypothetical protein